MSGFGLYIKVQFKRIWKIVPFIAVVSLLMAIALCILGMVSAKDGGKLSEKDERVVNVAIVGDMNQSYLGVGVFALTHLDPSGLAVNYISMESEEEARQELQKGNITAYIVVPEGYVDAVASGESMPLYYATSNDNTALGAALTGELVDSISMLMSEAKGSINASGQAARAQLGKGHYGPVTDEVLMKELETILNREQLFAVEETGVSLGLDIVSYFVLSITVFLCLLWGISCCSYFVNRSQSLERILNSKGVTAGWQVLGEFVPYALTMVVTMGLMSPFVGYFLGKLGIFEHSYVTLIMGLIPGMLLLSAFQFLLFELCNDMISAGLVQFFAALVTGFASGCLYPVSFLPKALQRISLILPARVTMLYGTALLEESNVGVSLLAVICYTLLLLAVTILIRRRRLTR